jgi:predicted Zn-dependent protease with MMP-like domain
VQQLSLGNSTLTENSVQREGTPTAPVLGPFPDLVVGGNSVTIGNEMERSECEALVEQVLKRLPRAFRERLTNVAIIVEDLPPKEEEREGLLLGLFHGIPRTEKSVFVSTPPDRIFLYQRNIEAVCANDAEVRRQIRATLLHEVGHYFGLGEDELRGL